MAKSRHHATPDVFDEFESSAERLADWVRRRALWLGACLALLIAGIWGSQAWIQAGERREGEATAALAGVRADYLRAMGADPGSLEPPELANPEAARRIRAEYATRFGEVADEHEGTVSGALARLEAVDLAEAEAGPDATLEALERTLEQAPAGGSLRAIVLQRIAQVQEAAGRFAEAAAAYESAGQIGAFPLRNFALADAARCYASAGEPARALALYEDLEAEAPELALPDHHRALRRELQAASAP